MAMHSLLVGSIAKPSSHASFSVSAELSSFTNVKVSRCTAWSSLGRYHVTSFKNLLAENHVRSIEKRSLPFLRCSRSHLVVAFSGQSLKSGPEAFSPRSSWNYLTNVLDAFYRFSRPHTVIGTVKFTISDSLFWSIQSHNLWSRSPPACITFAINDLTASWWQALSIVSVSLLAVKNLSDISPVFFTGMLQAIVAALFMNIYIVGLNQLFDIEIDKVNKPYLPLASGEYSVGTGVFIVASFAILSFWLGHIVGSWPLFWALFVSFILGTAYSINLPMLRWKRFALVAAMCILAVRAVIVQIAFFLHMQMHVYGRPAVFSRPLIFATAFMSFFSVVIALFKDIPDIEGDRIFGIRSFTVRLGQKRVFWTCISLLEMAYAVAIAVGASSSFLWSKVITVVGHVILAAFLWRGAKSVDLNNKAAITSFYMFIWKLFYSEYLLIPLVR